MRSVFLVFVFVFVFGFGFGFVSTASWGSPATTAHGVGAEASFETFASEWIGRALARSDRARKAPRAHRGSAGVRFTYHSVDDAFETELRPTGRPGSPYVGVLRYTEHTFTCEDVHGSECRVTSSLPVTEVFRYRDGRWTY